MTINELTKYLIAQGWRYRGDCNCGGMKTYKYEFKSGGCFFNLRVRANHFLLSTSITKAKRYPISEIKTIVDEISQANKTTVQAQA